VTRSCNKCRASFWVARGKSGRQRTRCDACRPNIAKIDGKRWRELRRQILTANPLCVYCGAPASELDHVVPLSMGGDPFALENLVSSCKRCNSSKGARLAAAARREPRVTTLRW
jgi:5-methylcytosine-specific restriction endonuclease McrA